jgi:hypothetical protein
MNSRYKYILPERDGNTSDKKQESVDNIQQGVDERLAEEFREFANNSRSQLPEDQLRLLWQKANDYAMFNYCLSGRGYHPYQTVARLSYMRALVTTTTQPTERGEQLEDTILGSLYKNKTDEADDGCWIEGKDFHKAAKAIVEALPTTPQENIVASESNTDDAPVATLLSTVMQESIDKMNLSIRCLFAQLPEEVAKDVQQNWFKARAVIFTLQSLLNQGTGSSDNKTKN